MKYFNFADPNKCDFEWSSTTTVSLEQDVSKVLQETVPSTRSLGAIPKVKSCGSQYSEFDRRPLTPIMKSESERNRRSKQEQVVVERYGTRQAPKDKVSKVTQTHTEGLECLVMPSYVHQR